MKETVRFLIEKLIEMHSGPMGNPSVLFPHFSWPLWPVIRNVKHKGFNVIFLPKRFNKKFAFDNFRPGEVYFEYCELKKDIQNWLLSLPHFPDYFVTDKVARDNLALHVLSEFSFRKIYLDHGENANEDEHIMYNRLVMFDWLYFTNTSMADFAWKCANKGNFSVKIRQWDRFQGKKWSRKSSRKKMLLYVPTMCCGERFCHNLTEAAKYRFKKELVKELGRIVRYCDWGVIWKKLPAGDENEDCVEELIAAQNLKEFRVETKNNLDRLMEAASAIVTDCVSTPMYDAARIGLPSLALIDYRAFLPRKDILRDFGDSVFVYYDDSFEDAWKKLWQFVEFLNNGGVWPVPKIERKCNPFLWEQSKK